MERCRFITNVPRDVLTDVLALLPPRTLAVSRCVCREWRDVVDADAHCQLRTDLLPLSVAGIFVETNEAEPPDFFVRPSIPHGQRPSRPFSRVHLGLLLDDDLVVNPTTRQWMRLPPYPTLHEEKQSSRRRCHYYSYLVFDPTLSPYFEVFSMESPLDYKDELSEESQWPPSEYMLRVYSSNTERSEERPFLREEEHTATAASVWSK
ncbi:hypothetical protein SORBI_3001G133800 [Sorghum bicolor]|uniref:F-box domain-containing protein n=1 Tax=Sorghum bicolor TaxID=4558 RepID=A0A1B6QIU3_SORBI|nr:hypothetical protein SORBI_3001G133800 [Sorghum bicolor]